MRCVICRNGETSPGTTTIVLQQQGLTFVVKSVPARVCANCGEEYVEEAVAAQLLRQAEEASRKGSLVDIREYATA